MPGVVDLLKAQVHFQSSGLAKVHFLINVTKKTTARLAKSWSFLCARLQRKGCHSWKCGTCPGALGSAWSRSQVSNIQPVGRIWPTTWFYLARHFVCMRSWCQATCPQAPARSGHCAARVTQLVLQEQNGGSCSHSYGRVVSLSKKSNRWDWWGTRATALGHWKRRQTRIPWGGRER